MRRDMKFIVKAAVILFGISTQMYVLGAETENSPGVETKTAIYQWNRLDKNTLSVDNMRVILGKIPETGRPKEKSLIGIIDSEIISLVMAMPEDDSNVGTFPRSEKSSVLRLIAVDKNGKILDETTYQMGGRQGVDSVYEIFLTTGIVKGNANEKFLSKMSLINPQVILNIIWDAERSKIIVRPSGK